MDKMLFYVLLFPLSYALTLENITWLTSDTHDFGTFKSKEVRYTFSFRNDTDQPVLIEQIRTTCGCTVPDWKEFPILPDSTGSIEVTYDGKRRGYFRKKIMVFFNHQRKPENLWITGYVED